MERASGMTDAGTGTALVSGITYGPANETLQMSYGDLYGGTSEDRGTPRVSPWPIGPTGFVRHQFST